MHSVLRLVFRVLRNSDQNLECLLATELRAHFTHCYSRRSLSSGVFDWSPRAISHLADLRAYVAHDTPDAAARIATTLLGAVERLAELPNLGRPGRVAGTRELVVPSTKVRDSVQTTRRPSGNRRNLSRTADMAETPLTGEKEVAVVPVTSRRSGEGGPVQRNQLRPGFLGVRLVVDRLAVLRWHVRHAPTVQRARIDFDLGRDVRG